MPDLEIDKLIDTNRSTVSMQLHRACYIIIRMIIIIRWKFLSFVRISFETIRLSDFIIFVEFSFSRHSVSRSGSTRKKKSPLAKEKKKTNSARKTESGQSGGQSNLVKDDLLSSSFYARACETSTSRVSFFVSRTKTRNGRKEVETKKDERKKNTSKRNKKGKKKKEKKKASRTLHFSFGTAYCTRI